MQGLEHYRVGDVVEVLDEGGNWVPGVVTAAGVGMPIAVKTAGPMPVIVTDPAKIRPRTAPVPARIPGKASAEAPRTALLLGGTQNGMVLTKLAGRGGAKLLVATDDIEIDQSG